MSVPADELAALLRQIHVGPSQEAAAARVGLALWRRALARGDAAAAAAAVGQVEAHLEALFDGLAEVESRGRALLRALEGP